MPEFVARAYAAFQHFDWSDSELLELHNLFLRAARVVDDRNLDVPKSLRNQIARKLESAGLAPMRTATIKAYTPVGRTDRTNLYGEALPAGLVLDPSLDPQLMNSISCGLRAISLADADARCQCGMSSGHGGSFVRMRGRRRTNGEQNDRYDIRPVQHEKRRLLSGRSRRVERKGGHVGDDNHGLRSNPLILDPADRCRRRAIHVGVDGPTASSARIGL